MGLASGPLVAQLPTLQFALYLIPLNRNILFAWEEELQRRKLTKRESLGNSADYRISTAPPQDYES